MSETLWEFLERRERELSNRLIVAETAVSEIRRELDEIKRAREAAGARPSPLSVAGFGPAYPDQLAALQDHLNATRDGAVGALTLHSPLAKEGALSGVTALSPGFAASSGGPVISFMNDPADRTIQHLILSALLTNPEFRQNGASAAELRLFILDAYGRDIDRASLSPQLSRLKADGTISARANRWYHVQLLENPDHGGGPP